MARAVKMVAANRKVRDGANAAATNGMKRADFVSAFARGLDVIKAFDAERPRHSIATAADATGMNRAATRRVLLTLVELGYARLDGELFELTPRVMELGYSYLGTWKVAELVRPSLQTVVDAVHENCSMGVLDGGDVVYIARAEARRIVQSAIISVGSRVPSSVASMGRAILANSPRDFVISHLDRYPLRKFTEHTVTSKRAFVGLLAEARAQGWALVDGEFEDGLMSLAVPIFDADGIPIAAINVGTPSLRTSREQMIERFLPPLQRAAQAIADSFKFADRRPSDLVMSHGSPIAA